jgi:hypothetical protein
MVATRFAATARALTDSDQRLQGWVPDEAIDVIHVRSLGGQFHRVRKSHGYQKTRLSPLRKSISRKRKRKKYAFSAGFPTTTRVVFVSKNICIGDKI